MVGALYCAVVVERGGDFQSYGEESGWVDGCERPKMSGLIT